MSDNLVGAGIAFPLRVDSRGGLALSRSNDDVGMWQRCGALGGNQRDILNPDVARHESRRAWPIGAARGHSENRQPGENRAPRLASWLTLDRRGKFRAGPQSMVMLSVLPSGSLNQAIRAPLGDCQTPSLSWPMPSYRSNLTPAFLRRLTASTMSGTCQPSTV